MRCSIAIRMCIVALTAASLLGTITGRAMAQGGRPNLPQLGLSPGEVRVTKEFESVEVVLGSSRLITMPFSIPRVVVEDPSILSATPLSRDQILIRALQAGVTGVGILDENGRSYTIEVNVVNDVRQLQAIINHTFPTANVTVRPLRDAIILVGTVPNPEMAAQVVDVAGKFSEQVFQNLQVSGAQNIALKMKVYEVSMNKFRRIGADLQIGNNKLAVAQGVSDLIDMTAVQATGASSVMFDPDGRILTTGGDTLKANFINGSTQFFSAIEFMEQHDVARLLDEPTLVTLNGRPAEFLSGGEIPILVNAVLGVASIEFRPFGTKVDFLPISLGDGRLRIDLRYEVSQLAPGLSGDTDTPGFTVSRTNIAAEMAAGHSLAIAGVIKEQQKTTKRGLPGLMHAPWIGGAFRKNQDELTGSELLVVATPTFVGEVDPAMLPAFGPGQNTEAPLNKEFYGRGYLEVPRCDPPTDQAGYTAESGMYIAPATHKTPATGPVQPGVEVPLSAPGSIGHSTSVRPGGVTPRIAPNQQAVQPLGVAAPRR